MTHNEMIAVIAACRDGKAVESKHKIHGENWKSFSNRHGWNFNEFDYRIKPEPRVIWVNEYSSSLGMAYYTKEEANRAFDQSRISCLKFVEVIE